MNLTIRHKPKLKIILTEKVDMKKIKSLIRIIFFGYSDIIRERQKLIDELEETIGGLK
jgi:hypothetical protein